MADAATTEEPTEDERMRAVRRYTQWHLGDPRWADLILHAYHNPRQTIEELRRDGMKSAGG